MILSIVCGDSLVRQVQLARAGDALVERIRTEQGTVFLLEDEEGRAGPLDVVATRVGTDLKLSQCSLTGQEEMLILGDFFGSNARLLARRVAGQELECVVSDVMEAVETSGLHEGASLQLSMAAYGVDPSSAGGSSADSSVARIAAAEISVAASGPMPEGERNCDTSDHHGSPDSGASEAAAASGQISKLGVAGVAHESLLTNPAHAGNAVKAAEAVAAVKAAVACDVIQQSDPQAVPAIDAVLDAHGAIQGVIESGGYTDDSRPHIIGKADAGTVVSVFRGGYLIGSVTSDVSGAWSLVPPGSLGDGTHSLTVMYQYSDGSISDVSVPYLITIDTITPRPPVVTAVVDDQGRITGVVADQAVTDDNQPGISGVAEAHSTVTIYDKGRKIGQTTVAADGVWTFTPDTPLADGLHILSFSAEDRAGNVSERSIATEFVVDTRPEQVSIYFAEDDIGSVTDALFSGSTTDDSMPTLRGAATAGGVVRIYEGELLLGEATAGFDGSWRFTLSTPLAEGAHTLHATVTREATGESAPSEPFHITVDLTPPGEPSIDSARDNAGSIQGLLSSGAVTDDDTPTLIGTAAAGSRVTIHLDGVTLGSVVTAEDGNWRFTPDVPLGDGAYHFTATTMDQVGNVSPPSAPFALTIDTLAPVKPSIDSIVDAVGGVTGPITNGATTDDARPNISGRAEAGSVVVVKDDGMEIGRTLANAEGHWVFVPSPALVDGDHSLTVEAVDAAGNTSEPSDGFEFTVDTYLPTALVTRIGRDSGFDDGDFLTNDGSAGRVIRGVLSDSLRGDQRVEVSTDGGVTWSGVSMRHDGGWMFVDYNSHAASWEILTRISSETGFSGEATSQLVNLDVVAPAAPTGIVSSGSAITVTFEPASVAEGYRLYVNEGTHYFEYRLSAAEVLAGTVTVVPSFQVSRMTKAAIVDLAGNASKFLLNPAGTINEDFSNTTDRNVYTAGDTLVLDTMSVKVLQGRALIGTYNNTPGFGEGKRLYFGYSGKDRLEISFEGSSKVTFTTDYLHNAATYTFYDIHGNVLSTQEFARAPGGYRVSYVAEPGVLIGSVVAYTTEWGFLDNFEFSIPDIPTLVDDARTKLVDDLALHYQGDGRDETFVVGSGSVGALPSINGNGGVDTLQLLGTGRVLDLSAEGGGVKSVEIIDMTRGTGNVLRMSVEEVLENGAIGAFGSADRVQMAVLGNTGDTVELNDLLDGEMLGWWIHQAQVSLGGITYDVYQHSGVLAEVLVQVGVAVQIGLGTRITIDSVGQNNDGVGFEVTDGASGQLVKGILSGALAEGAILQVSVDEGVSWQDALVNGTSWAFLDTSGHAGHWTVQTRISDGANHVDSPTQQSVNLLAGYGAPTITRIPDAEGIYTITQASDGSVMTVSLADTGANVGDKIHIKWGTSTYDQTLTQTNINSGFVTLNVPDSVTYSAQGYSRDFSVFAQIVGKNGALGARSAPYDVIAGYTRVLTTDNLQQAPLGNEYSGNGFTVTTNGSMAKTGSATNSLAGLTLSDHQQAQATFTLGKPADQFSLRLSGAENQLGAHIRVFDVDGKLMYEETVFGDATSRHVVTFKWTKSGLADIGSFTVESASSSVTLDAFSHYVVTHVAETRDPDLIDVLAETFYGTDGDDKVSLSLSAATYLNQASAAVHGGQGIDTLALAGAWHVLNLTTAAGKVRSIEIMDITGSGNNTLVLDLADVLRNGAVDAFHVGDESRVQMMVKGNAGDKVNLSNLLAGGVDHGDWLKKDPVLLGDEAYETYQHSNLGVELLVQQGIAVVVSSSTLEAAVSGAALELDAVALLHPGADLLLGDTQESATIGVREETTAPHWSAFLPSGEHLRETWLEAC